MTQNVVKSCGLFPTQISQGDKVDVVGVVCSLARRATSSSPHNQAHIAGMIKDIVDLYSDSPVAEVTHVERSRYLPTVLITMDDILTVALRDVDGTLCLQN